MAENSNSTHKIYPSDLLISGSRYGDLFCLITVLDTYSGVSGEDASKTIKDVSGKIAQLPSNMVSVKGETARQATFGNKRNVKENIFLPMPLTLDTNYGVSYNDNFSYVEEGGRAFSPLIDSAGNALNFLSKTFPKASSFTKLVGGMTPSALKIGGAAAGLALNPHKELLFDGVKFREFKLKYKLIAKSKKESNDIKDIIKIFEKYMHPTLEASTFLYRYPAEFEIRFFTSDGKQNKFLHKLYRCVLQNFSVSYGGNNFVTFKNQDGTTEGAPVEIEINLDFKETNPLTREFIEEVLYKDDKTKDQSVQSE